MVQQGKLESMVGQHHRLMLGMDVEKPAGKGRKHPDLHRLVIYKGTGTAGAAKDPADSQRPAVPFQTGIFDYFAGGSVSGD